MSSNSDDAAVGENSQNPRGELALKALAMPADANPAGDIFGGWLMSQMDIAGGISAYARAQGRVATVAVDGFTFHKPVLIGDVLSCYVDILKTGNSSITARVEAWIVRRETTREEMKVTEGIFTFVALNEDGSKRRVP
jgi:acyl-CoA thioesterase YciA